MNTLNDDDNNNLHKDARDMCLVSFFIYVWARIVHTVPIPKKESWSPHDVKRIMKQNRSKLIKEYPDLFKDGSSTYQALDVLIQRSPNRELTLCVWDSDYQTNELVFGICKE
jgi:hypothetical protein